MLKDSRHTLFTTDDSLILASGSPRRQQMLGQLGIAFTVITADVDERPLAGERPAAYVKRLAAAKAEAVAAQHPASWVLAADTIVTAAGHLLGKPTCATQAAAMLADLAGQRHEVLTGVCLLHHGRDRRHLFYCQTAVWFQPLDEQLIAAYVATGEPLDKAGAYGIQGLGGCLVERIEGSYTNVVGLPLAQTITVLRKAGVIAPAAKVVKAP